MFFKKDGRPYLILEKEQSIKKSNYTLIAYDKDKLNIHIEMANKPVPVGITRTRPHFDGESPL